MSGHSFSKLQRIKNYWLDHPPATLDLDNPCQYLIIDGTYFNHTSCLLTIMDAQTQKIIANTNVQKESYQATQHLIQQLHEKGVNPCSITVDGHRSVIRAVKGLWPNTIIQRCLYHIQREGLRWLRTYPKTKAGQDLRFILSSLNQVKSLKTKNVFVNTYQRWLMQHKSFIRSLPNTSVALKDLKKTMVLIDHALPDMFYYLYDRNIPSTTNLLESFYSRLKADYRRHRGLSVKHKSSYLQWYCYFKNKAK